MPVGRFFASSSEHKWPKKSISPTKVPALVLSENQQRPLRICGFFRGTGVSKMHLLDHILKLVTLASVIVGATAIYIALRNHSRQLGAQIFIAYTDRLLKLRRMLTIEADVYRLSWAAEEALTVAERHALLEAFYLVFEFYELRRHSYITAEIWGIWAPDIKPLLCTPIVRSEWPRLREEFIIHPKFVTWIEDGQQDATPLREPGTIR
jgi:hypothetical protein